MRGLRVGLLDADVYGPSQPRMLGVGGRPSSPDGRTILPLRNHGVTVMSLGLMMPDDEALMAWPDVNGCATANAGSGTMGPTGCAVSRFTPGTGMYR